MSGRTRQGLGAGKTVRGKLLQSSKIRCRKLVGRSVKDEIMEYKISGQQRRYLKKEISLLRRGIACYWHWWQTNNDMYFCYGHENPITSEMAERQFANTVKEIEMKELLLAETN